MTFRKIMKDVIEKKDPKYPYRIYYVDKNNQNNYYMQKELK